ARQAPYAKFELPQKAVRLVVKYARVDFVMAPIQRHGFRQRNQHFITCSHVRSPSLQVVSPVCARTSSDLMSDRPRRQGPHVCPRSIGFPRLPASSSALLRQKARPIARRTRSNFCDRPPRISTINCRSVWRAFLSNVRRASAALEAAVLLAISSSELWETQRTRS